MSEDKEKVLEKLRKLNAMAESAAELGNEFEAQAFAAKVQELLTAYKLSQADIGQGQKTEGPINITYLRWTDLELESRKVRIGWTEQLAQFVANAYYCDFIISGWGGNIGMMVGAETDRKIAVFMFVTLGRFLHRQAKRELDKRWKECEQLGDVTLCRGFKAGFITGFLQRLRERFDEEIRPKVDPAAQAATTAIIHIRRNALDRVHSWTKDNMSTRPMRAVSMDYGNRDGRERGKKAANDIDLRGKAFEHSGVTIQRIGAGS